VQQRRRLNEEGATLAFSLAPLAPDLGFVGLSGRFLALLWALYQWRIQQVQRQEKQLRDVIDTIPAWRFPVRPTGRMNG